MTTITIDRKVLEQALNALLLPCDRWDGGQFLIVNAAVNSVQNALEAPVAAPAKELRSRDKSGRAVMITITIDRKLLEEVVELFDSAITARHPHEILRDIRAALAAPATAPAQPERKPMTKGQREQVARRAEAAMNGNVNLSWRDALISETEAFHDIKETP